MKKTIYLILFYCFFFLPNIIFSQVGINNGSPSVNLFNKRVSNDTSKSNHLENTNRGYSFKDANDTTLKTVLTSGNNASSLCQGSLGDPVVNITFGTGTTPGQALPAIVAGASTTMTLVSVSGNPARPDGPVDLRADQRHR